MFLSQQVVGWCMPDLTWYDPAVRNGVEGNLWHGMGMWTLEEMQSAYVM